MAIQWDEAIHGTHYESVDDQHKRLFDMIGELLSAKDEKPQKVREMMEFLGKYVIEHFQEEEKLMEATNCPAAAENKQAHAKFIEKFKELVQLFEEEGYSNKFAMKLRTSVLMWLSGHIATIDTQLRASKKA